MRKQPRILSICVHLQVAHTLRLPVSKLGGSNNVHGHHVLLRQSAQCGEYLGGCMRAPRYDRLQAVLAAGTRANVERRAWIERGNCNVPAGTAMARDRRDASTTRLSLGDCPARNDSRPLAPPRRCCATTDAR